MTASAPSRTAALTAHVMPRSLNEPVGLAPSSFSQTSRPTRSETWSARHERRRALLERHDGVAGIERQPVAVALDEAGHQVELFLDDPDRARARAHEVQARDQVDRGEELRLQQRVHDHHQPRVLPQPLLHDRLDRRALQAEDLRDLREHAGPVGDLQVQVERRLDVARRSPAPAVASRRRGRRDHRADDVAEHRARRLRAAGARAAQRDLGDRLRLDRHGVERAADAGQRVAAVEERRVHADAEAAVDALGGADQLQPEAELARVLHVVGGDVLDALVA